jgi:Leucine-rich repeat (LRR) protein
LDLEGTPVSDPAPLAGAKKLKWLDLANTPVSDVTPLAGMNNLRVLYLNRTRVSQEQIDWLKLKLPNCTIK